MLILTVVTGPDKGTVYKLAGDARIRIGRRHGDIPLNDKGASSKHAEINPTDGGWTLSDLESSNGTYLNKERIDLPTAISDGDRLQVGRSMIVFNVVEAELSDDAEQDAGPTAAIHAALAAQHRNQTLLTEIRSLLESRAEGTLDSTGDTSGGDEVAGLMRQVIERLDASAAATAPTVEPDGRIDDVLDQLRSIRQREVVVPPAPKPVDLQPVLDAIEKIQTPPAPGASDAGQPVDLQPILDAIESLKQAQPTPEAVDLSPVLEKLDTLEQATPQAPEAPAVDLTPVLEKLDALGAERPGVDLQPVLDAIESLKETSAAPEPTDLTPVLEAIAANKPNDPAERFDQLGQQIAQLQEALAQSNDTDEPQAIDAAELRDQLAAIRRGVELDRTGELTAKLDRIVESIERTPDTPDNTVTIDPTVLREGLNVLAGKVDELSKGLSQTGLDDKIDQLLDIATSPAEPTDAAPAPVDPALIEKLEQVLAAVRETPTPEPTDLAPITERLAELRSSVDAIAERTEHAGASSDESNDATAAMVPQILERIDRMESALSGQASQTGDAAEAAVGAIGERIEAIVDVLRAMPSATGSSDNDDGPAPAGIDEQLVAELNAKLEVIFESIQQQQGERAETSSEIDSLIEMMRSEHASTDTESALAKVIARLDRMEQPSPVLDDELLERLEKVSLKLDNLQISGFDIPDPTPLLADTIEPLLRQIHDKVTHGEAVDLRPTEQRIAELTESVRDAVNHSDRPLLEQILVEIRDRSGGGEGSGDKLELILERVSRIDDLKELEPLLHQVKDAASLGSNDKVIALLRQLIEHVQTMPSKFDGKETIDNVFQSLRRLEQQQEQQAATLRRLVASVAESEERLSRAVATNPPARTSMRFAPKNAPASIPAPGAPRGDTDIDPELESMLTGTDPGASSAGRRKVPILLIALIIAVPVLGIVTIMNWNEIKNFNQWFDSTPNTPANDTNRATPKQPDTGLTRR